MAAWKASGSFQPCCRLSAAAFSATAASISSISKAAKQWQRFPCSVLVQSRQNLGIADHRDGRLLRIQCKEKFRRLWDAVEVVDEDDGIEQPL